MQYVPPWFGQPTPRYSAKVGAPRELREKLTTETRHTPNDIEMGTLLYISAEISIALLDSFNQHSSMYQEGRKNKPPVAIQQ